MKKQYIFGGLVLGAAAGMGILYSTTRKDPQTGNKQIEVEVIHKDGSKKSWTISSDANTLSEALLEENLIEGSDGPYGLFVEEVDGERAVYDQDKAYWRLQIDGQDASSGADSTILEDQQVYTWIYTAE